MAAQNYLSANMQFVSSTAGPIALPLMRRITAIKYFTNGSLNSSAAILSGTIGGGPNSTGSQIWFENTTTAGHVTDLLSIFDPDGVTVSIGGGASIWIYSTISRGV